MKSNFYFSYILSFFFLLFSTCYIFGEPGIILTHILIALGLATFFKAASLFVDISLFFQLLFGVILTGLGCYDLLMVDNIYRINVLGAFLPVLIFAAGYDKMGPNPFKILYVSILEVFSFGMAFASMIGIICNLLPSAKKILFAGGDVRYMFGSCALFILALIMLVLGVRKTSKEQNEGTKKSA